MINSFMVHLPALLSGARCYTDASILPDAVSSLPRTAGIGIFIINMQVHPPEQIYIKATMSDSSSVIMAEATALALAAAVTERLNIHHINFLSDNQQLVHFFNGSDGSNPPDWRIKHLTQSFINHTKERKYKALQGP
jgi:putative N-acetylmannosamine-6-phosphate epimerase